MMVKMMVLVALRLLALIARFCLFAVLCQPYFYVWVFHHHHHHGVMVVAIDYGRLLFRSRRQDGGVQRLQRRVAIQVAQIDV